MAKFKKKKKKKKKKNTRPIGTNVIPTISFVCIQQLHVNKKNNNKE